MKILDGISRPEQDPLVAFIISVHPVVWYGFSALVGLIIGFLK